MTDPAMKLAAHVDDLDDDGHDTHAAGSAEDPIFDAFGAPDTAHEFDTSSLTGWTSFGSLTASDADTTVPGHLYLENAATASVDLSGYYHATGTFPQTIIAKLSDHTLAAVNYERVGGLFVGQATPGVIEAVYIVHNNDWTISHERYTNPTTYSATVGTDILQKVVAFPLYYAIVINSSTDVDFWVSLNGRVWRKRTDARDPSITVGSYGVFVDPESSTYGAAAAYDYVRVWDSALTFPGL